MDRDIPDMVTEVNQITNKLMELPSGVSEHVLEDLSALHVNSVTFTEIKQEIKAINDNVYKTMDMYKSNDFSKDQAKLELDEIYIKHYIALTQLSGLVKEMQAKIESLKTFLPN